MRGIMRVKGRVTSFWLDQRAGQFPLMWTAPPCKSFFADLIGSLACICPAYGCARTWTLAKMVSAARVPNTMATLSGQGEFRSVTRLGSIDHTICSFLQVRLIGILAASLSARLSNRPIS